MGKASRTKGAAGERAVARWLRPIFPTAARTKVGHAQDDIGGVPFSVEVKTTKNAALPAWITQAETQAGDRPWAVVWLRPGTDKDPDRGAVIVPGWWFTELLAAYDTGKEEE